MVVNYHCCFIFFAFKIIKGQKSVQKNERRESIVKEKLVHKVHRRLNFNDRLYIQNQIEKDSVSRIANHIGVNRSTIYKELKRGSVDGTYNAEYAQKKL